MMRRTGRWSLTSSRRAGLVGALAVVALASACSGSPPGSGGSGVFDTGIAPVPLGLTGPTYAAVVPGGMLVRAGEEQQVLRDADQVRWLPGGVAIVDRSPRSIDMHLVDPSQDVLARATPSSGVRVRGGDLPGRSVTQVNALNPLVRPPRLTTYTPQLEKLDSLPLPDTDDPAADDNPEIRRGYYNVAPTINGATFVQWHDYSETYDDGDYGVARIEGGEVDHVLVNERIVALYLAADGAGLLALRQRNGDPCGGCVVDQEVVEIDPASGEIAAKYGMPDEYVEEWRVAAMDKVGDRVAVRFTETAWDENPKHPNAVAPYSVQRGTWVYDGDWSMVKGSEDELTWWQGEGRVVARPVPGRTRSSERQRLFWVRADGTEEALPGDLESEPGRRYAVGAVTGQLLPPG